MRTCCVKGCDSSKYITLKYYAFFNFPLDDEVLLKKWLNGINQPDLEPKFHQICSIHFKNDEIVWRPDGLPPSLKPTAIPTIFPHEETNSPVAPTSTQTFLVTIPIDQSSKSPNGEINGNCKLPLILIPTQYLFPCQPSVPYVIPTQLAPQFNPQNHQQTQPVAQINPQDQLQTQPVVQIHPQNWLEPHQFPQINIQNPQQSIKFLSQLKAINPTLSGQLVQQISAQNSIIAEQFPQIKVQSQENNLQASKINIVQNPMDISADLQSNDQGAGVGHEMVQDSVTIAQISQPNGHRSVPIPESQKSFEPEQLKKTNLRSHSDKRVEYRPNLHAKGQSPGTISENLEMKHNSKIPVSKELGMEENSQSVIQVATNSSERGGHKTSEPFAEKSSVLPPAARKILPETTFPRKTNIYEQEVHVRRVSNPDILIIPKSKIPESSEALDRTKTPILRIAINKLCNVPSESEYTSRKGNSPGKQQLSEKSITIENHATNKSVIFRLDSKSGEIVVENRDFVQSPKQSRSRNTGKKRKVDTSVPTPSANLRRLYAREQRECSAFRRELKLLRQSHKDELEEIQKLQNFLSDLQAVKQSTLSDGVTTELRLGSDKSSRKNDRTVENSKKTITPRNENPQCDEKGRGSEDVKRSPGKNERTRRKCETFQAKNELDKSECR